MSLVILSMACALEHGVKDGPLLRGEISPPIVIGDNFAPSRRGSAVSGDGIAGIG